MVKRWTVGTSKIFGQTDGRRGLVPRPGTEHPRQCVQMLCGKPEDHHFPE